MKSGSAFLLAASSRLMKYLLHWDLVVDAGPSLITSTAELRRGVLFSFAQARHDSLQAARFTNWEPQLSENTCGLP